MKILHRLACCCALLAALPAWADASAERQRIDRERQAIEARFAAEEAACRERFVVTACVDEVKVRKRQALGGLRSQELMLDDADRKARAAARLQAIEAKRLEAQSRPPAPPQPAPVLRHPLPGASAPPRAAHAPRETEEAQAAARRAAAAERRREEAEADRAKIAAREAERQAKGKKAAPLPAQPPVPASAP